MPIFICMISVHLCLFALYQIEATLAVWDDRLGLLGANASLTRSKNIGYSASQEEVKEIAKETTPSDYICVIFNAGKQNISQRS